MPNMRIRSKVAVTTQIPISTMTLVDMIRDEHRVKITNLFELALETYIAEHYPDVVEKVEASEESMVATEESVEEIDMEADHEEG